MQKISAQEKNWNNSAKIKHRNCVHSVESQFQFNLISSPLQLCLDGIKIKVTAFPALECVV